MRRVLGALIALTLTLGGAASAGAATGGIRGFPGVLTLDPSSGPAGSTFTVSGDQCDSIDGGEMSVEVTAPETVEGTASTEPDQAGDWSVELTVPDDAEADAVIEVDANCIETFGGQINAFQSIRRAPAGNFISASYPTAEFTVTAGPTTTVEETTTTEGTTTTTEAGEVDDSDAAAPVVAQPTFTG